jgi:hypothetical protein
MPSRRRLVKEGGSMALNDSVAFSDCPDCRAISSGRCPRHPLVYVTGSTGAMSIANVEVKGLLELRVEALEGQVTHLQALISGLLNARGHEWGGL